ncbi:uncharacterized protein LOC117339098 [Pecten maximus]|uniref:uncharacterized protein LOC117339098 n=1 Tax=Pecten maximus TaxID=6579 RepID=UPI0014584F80|nr:uncharacterized protein LOC117339098 [Pecten maximus]
MALSREEAYDILELPVGADQDSVRTSYKRLALKWHPDKHSGSSSTEAVKNFRSISIAYKRLSAEDEDHIPTSMDQMLSLFKEVFFPRSVGNSYHNGSGYDTSDSEDDEEYDDDIQYSNLFPDKFKLKQEMKKAKTAYECSDKHLTVEEINKNAEELITEEEKEKKKAEKRKAKKKRRRERKRQEKGDNLEIEEDRKIKPRTKDSENSEKNKGNKMTRDSSSSSDEAGFDPHSAFFTKVVNKKKKTGTTQSSEHSSKKDKKGGSEDDAEDLDPVVLRSRQLAIKGNEMAQLSHYNAAIELFSEAIKLDPNDFRFFGNRSYCYDRIQQYDRALKDAEKAIYLSKEWPKGYFRKGRALAGLRMFSEAEDAFTQVLKLDKNCEDAVTELLRVRTHQITDMGFSRQQAEAAIKLHGTVQSALDSLLAGVAENVLGVEVYVSDDDEGFTITNSRTSQPKKSDAKMDHNNPDGLTALWVGNVLPDKVDDKKLFRIFSRYGAVTSVRCLPEKYCAFINYKTKEAAGKAMQHLQGAECGGQNLLIKFPDNPIVNGSGNITLRKNHQKTSGPATITIGSSTPLSSSSNKVQVSATVAKVADNLPKQSGPVNGDECYFWRTTGCVYGDKCRNKHVADHRGLDKKPWQKS